MPRRARFHIDGLPLHIVQRGHNRAACFFDDQDGEKGSDPFYRKEKEGKRI